MYENGEWYGHCGKVADAMNRVIKLDRREELLEEIGDASSEVARLEREALHYMGRTVLFPSTVALRLESAMSGLYICL